MSHAKELVYTASFLSAAAAESCMALNIKKIYG